MPPAFSVLQTRRALSDKRLADVRKALAARGWEARLGETACVYATGSIGRGEASEHSDLDVFILSTGKRKLARLDAIPLKSDLIEINAATGFPQFSGDGRWLEDYELSNMVEYLGGREDDATNVFTARLLMLLESRCLVGHAAYDRALNDVIAAYWRDYAANRTDFYPTFLFNDIVKYWKVLCLEYEKNTVVQPGTSRIDAEASRRYSNYKLKFSRLLICYSAIAHLAFCWRQERTVRPQHVRRMVKMSPIERLVFIGNQDDRFVAPMVIQGIENLLSRYEAFLVLTDADKASLIKAFRGKTFRRERRAEAILFGNAMFDLVYAICGDLPLFRFLVI